MAASSFHSTNQAKLAAEYAVKVAKRDSPDWRELTDSICYKAIRLCLKNSGAINQTQFNVLNTMGSTNFYVFVRNTDPTVFNADIMRTVPQGSILAFVDRSDPGSEYLSHAMIATGHGMAAGTKNSCIGIGTDYGWELLDLANNLTWTTTGEIQQTHPETGTRLLTLRYRTLPL